MNNLNAPHFHDDDAARRYLEAIRWSGGIFCPHCGSTKPPYKVEGKGGAKGTKARPGLYKCSEKGCRKQFSVTVGTVFERSHIPLSKWLAAAYLLCSSKKGISAHQLHRTLGVTYKTAWFLAHRIRHAMEAPAGMFGSGGGIVEADETYIGRKAGAEVKVGWGHKQQVFALVERNGKARSFRVHGKMFDTVKDVLTNNVAADAHIMTDEARLYNTIGKRFATHNRVNHSAV
jgi:transposase-like protein